VTRWPYRVVFWPANAPGQRHGTISRPSLEAAQTEAQTIADDGGTAEVRYVHPNGQQETIATYRPSPAKRARLGDRLKKVAPRFRWRPRRRSR
jgi:hypothetical protein